MTKSILCGLFATAAATCYAGTIATFGAANFSGFGIAGAGTSVSGNTFVGGGAGTRPEADIWPG
jgi:hypothetical protein